MALLPHKLSCIKVGRYAEPLKVGWLGWLEDAEKTWIAYIDLNGRPRFFLKRDPTTGAALD
jgi:hypothetical protein